MSQNLDAIMANIHKKQIKQEQRKKNKLFRLWFFLLAHPLILIFVIITMLEGLVFAVFYQEITTAMGLQPKWEIVPVEIKDPPKEESVEKAADLKKPEPTPKPKPAEKKPEPDPQKQNPLPQTNQPVQQDWQRYEQFSNFSQFSNQFAFQGANGLGGTGGESGSGSAVAPPPPPPPPPMQRPVPKPAIPRPVIPKNPAYVNEVYRSPTIDPEKYERFVEYVNLDEEVRLQAKNNVQDFLKYPDEARRAGLSGEVVMQLQVGKSGKVYEAKVVKSVGHGMDTAAVDAVKKLEFEPYRIDDDRVGINGYPYKVVFELKE